jgi:hypothetical protein
MSKKQNKTFNFILIFLIFSVSAFAAPVDEDIQAADSLFQLRKYTESFEIYNEIYEQGNVASAQMLMKMAFIKEGLGDYSRALYFLNKYYQQTSDKRARQKMKELADENELLGYSSTDTDFFKGQVTQYYLIFIYSVFVIIIFLTSIIAYRKFKTKSNTTPYVVAVIVVMLSFFWVLNFVLQRDRGIIVENHAYLMSGPSAASDLLDVVKKGHRLDILDQEGIWVEVDWDGQSAYIRASKIMPLN